MTVYHYLECDKCKTKIDLHNSAVFAAPYPLKEGWMHFFEGIRPMIEKDYVSPDDFYTDLCKECVDEVYPIMEVEQNHAHFDTTGNGFCDECDEDLCQMGS